MADENGTPIERAGPSVSQGNEAISENVNASQPLINAMMMPWFMGVPWIPKFNGDPSKMRFSEWNGQVQAMLRAQGLNEEQKIDFIFGALEGEAKREIRLLDKTKRATGAAILKELGKLYGQVTPVAQLRAQFFKCHQQEGETAAAYILRLRELFSVWRDHEPNGSAQDEMTIRDQLVLGLRPSTVQQELQRQVRRNPTMSFSEVCSEARALEAEQRLESACAARVSVPPPQQVPVAPSLSEWRETVRAELKKEMKDQISVLTETLKDEIKRQLSPQSAPEEYRHPPTRGRVQERRYTPSPRRQQQFEWDQQGQPICRGCGQAGHIQRRCPHERRSLN